MPIFVRDNCFVLETPHTHYAFGVADGELQHIHWGEKCPRLDYTVPNYREEVSQHPASEFDKREYVPFGGTNYRECALKCTFSDGCRDTVLQYDSYTLKDDTLTVICKDRHYPLTVKLIYQVQEDSDVLTRSAEIVNTGNSDITLHKAASAQLHLPSRAPYTVLNFNGSWSTEFRKAEEVLTGGSVVFESRRGLSALRGGALPAPSFMTGRGLFHYGSEVCYRFRQLFEPLVHPDEQVGGDGYGEAVLYHARGELFHRHSLLPPRGRSSAVSALSAARSTFMILSIVFAGFSFFCFRRGF